jgi:hypothetical protein
MASIFYGKYCIDYSILDGRVYCFEKKDKNDKFQEIDIDSDELIRVANEIAEYQIQRPGGYSAFIHKLAKEGKIKCLIT